MQRPDDYQTRRRHLASLADDELRRRFWEVTEKVVEPLVELARTHTSPSVERSVLLRMGFSSLEAQAIVKKAVDLGLLGKGAAHLVLRQPGLAGLSGLSGLSGPERGGSHSSADRAGGSDSDCRLEPDQRLDVEKILQGLEKYRPRRRGWSWRQPLPKGTGVGPFEYREVAENLRNSVPLPAARYFGGIDPQPSAVITTEIASGRFEDDLRRMRMAAWHGADHIMVIRTAGQSHYDGLIEGTPEGVGGVPITRKQIRATRKTLDLIEDEVGRPINFHSYVSGVAGPEVAVLFAEEGVNGAHQDPQYNVLYRNINLFRSFVDAGVAKGVMTWAGMAQIDGAHNANATAREAWKVIPELMVQHAINTMFSVKIGMPEENICLSSVPPTATPAPCVSMDLPYAVALRKLFSGYKIRAQMNTRYIESSTREATVTHVLNLIISKLTSSDIQSTITPDEGRNVPWHYFNIAALDTAKQVMVGLDGLREMVSLSEEALKAKIREITERATLFMEEIAEAGGYAAAVERGFFVDSGYYPERKGDGIARDPRGGVGADTIVPRAPDYFAPVCAHFGYQAPGAPDCSSIGGCTLCHPSKIRYIDELDEEDNVHRRLERTAEFRHPSAVSAALRPEVQWSGDGVVTLTIFLPASDRIAESAALEIGRRLGLEDPEVIHREVMHPAEGTLIELKGTVNFSIDPSQLVIPEKAENLSEEAIRSDLQAAPMTAVAATIGHDEHSVGMREIIDIKHGGLEKFGFKCHYLGTSVPVEKLVDAAVETDAEAILASTIITHADIHVKNLQRLSGLCAEKGIRDRIILVAGGTQVTDKIARNAGMDAGFGRGTKGIDVASFLIRRRREIRLNSRERP